MIIFTYFHLILPSIVPIVAIMTLIQKPPTNPISQGVNSSNNYPTNHESPSHYYGN